MTNPRKYKDYVQTGIYDKFLSNKNMLQTSIEERMYMRVLTEMCMNRFKWVNVPDGIDTRFLEYILFAQARAVFYFDKEYDRFFITRVAGMGPINMYDNPTTFTTLPNQGLRSKILRGNECVPIWANYLRTPDLDIVAIYAMRLAKFDQTIDTNVMTLRHPIVYAVDENQRLGAVNFNRQLQEGDPAIFSYSSNNIPGIADTESFFDFGVQPSSITELYTAKNKTWSECMTLLGINNANQDKKERLVADEVSANDSQVIAMRNVMMNSRKMACEQINKMYGLEIDVEWNMENDYLPHDELKESVKEKEDNEDGAIHD